MAREGQVEGGSLGPTSMTREGQAEGGRESRASLLPTAREGLMEGLLEERREGVLGQPPADNQGGPDGGSLRT